MGGRFTLAFPPPFLFSVKVNQLTELYFLFILSNAASLVLRAWRMQKQETIFMTILPVQCHLFILAITRKKQEKKKIITRQIIHCFVLLYIETGLFLSKKDFNVNREVAMFFINAVINVCK